MKRTEGCIDAIALIVIMFGLGYWMAVELAR